MTVPSTLSVRPRELYLKPQLDVRPGSPVRPTSFQFESEDATGVYVDTEKNVGQAEADSSDSVALIPDVYTSSSPGEAEPGVESGSEGRTTASMGHPCEWCSKGLTGRKQRFCSDACRMQHRRLHQRELVDRLLAGLESGLADLRRALDGEP